MQRKTINDETLRMGVDVLAERDSDLYRIRDRLGYPPLWAREPGFASLVHIILEQQVSIKAAATMFQRLASHLGSVTPELVQKAGESELRQVGLTRQKARYCVELANRVASGALELLKLDTLDDAQGRSHLLDIPGLGPWTVDVYYMMALRRANVWPQGDLALASALQDIKQLEARPTRDEQLVFAEQWKPWRAVAARMLWMHYLDARGQ
ncbi:DNA-3-methyladenine glycosylase 2 family protein [Marinobacter flavimaris]|jgi:DNA-3-methyladenine glycosylase II|uniref:DNA-3-methyladenine glycosylase II n=1 Tax=Marinobacter flavimaris TaxID=262076 RepID=A0A3D8H2B8_9GAMM|nr:MULTISPECIES: DNA-3-methyladenine glycosylase [Marinobacter]AKV95392.1 3-methyladenine DNA glycosylase [Marinobacter sp. CP1]MAI33217.1 DNA-3-methyladenine glycosylase 2 family protein [Rhodopirellula sp.]PPI80359.1 DNA-3-methyladenine glycosylase 2 family protein [Marinobacter flavimaris]RDU40798.1 DNA-3-methyladenine glycosylase 2 family protein [Marinobacter flavimaris]|tara:strand:+ start:8571 stop:9200 length:630 start_codon:yes stop_codon:yes gene_type:complete